MNLAQLISAFLVLYQTKEIAKREFRDAKVGDDTFAEKRKAMLDADEVCETSFQELAQAIDAARQDDELEETLETLSRTDRDTLQGVLNERGLLRMLSHETDDFLQLLIKYRAAGAYWTATQELNRAQRQHRTESGYDWDGFVASLTHIPAGVTEDAWKRASNRLTTRVEAGNAVDGLLLSKLVGDIAHELESKARGRYDSVSERLGTEVKELLSTGQFDREVAELPDIELRTCARDFCRRVPQLQPTTQVK